MRSLGLLSSGTSSPAWASQFNRLSTGCLLGLARKQPSFVCTSTGASRTGRLDGVLLLLEVKALAQPDACVRSVCQYPLSRGSFSNERSELLSFGYVYTYGCFISLGLHGKRSLTIVAGKKGKKADRDVLVKEREDDVEEDKRSSEQHEESAKGKKLKAKKKHDDDQQLDNADATAEHGSTESQLKSKKKKLKELSQNGDVLLGKFSKEEDKDSQLLENQKQEEAEAVVNGTLRGEDPKVQDKQKDKKKLKSKAAKSEEDLSYEDSGVTKDDDIRVETKSKNKRSTQKSEEVLDSDARSAVNVMEANVSAFADGEKFQEFKDAEQLANVVETELAEELDDLLNDDYFWEDDFEPEPEVGDGGEGGGVIFGDSSWGPKALNLANDVLALFNGGLAIFAFKVYEESDLIRLRLDKLSDKYGSPTIDEIQQFSSSYSKSLERSGEAGIIPKNLAFEVSSPGAERVVQIPQDLERFKELPMYVRYLETGVGEEAEEKDGVFELESVDTESMCSVWKLANVRINRESIGKGRGLNKKQREWRCQIPFKSLQLVRLYIDL